jgi:hypothetical protein
VWLCIFLFSCSTVEVEFNMFRNLDQLRLPLWNDD